jgi:cytochrome c-type biogenesis protein CcmH
VLAAALATWLASPILSVVAQVDPARTDKDAYQRVSDRLICQCGCNYGLSHCPHLECPSAPVLRAAIRDKLAQGLSEERVLKAMVADFGPGVLAAPPAEGFNLTAWVMPFVALSIGLWLAIVVVRRWRQRAPERVADPSLVDRYRSKLEQELKHLEQ